MVKLYTLLLALALAVAPCHAQTRKTTAKKKAQTTRTTKKKGRAEEAQDNLGPAQRARPGEEADTDAAAESCAATSAT